MATVSGPREDGVVKSFNKVNGYGFIRVQSRADDVYFKTEDLTPRSQQHMLEVPRINGTSITCSPEAFGASRVRARSVSLSTGNETIGAKQPNAISRENINAVEAITTEPSQSAAISKNTAGSVQPSCKTSPAARPRGWAVPSAREDAKSTKAQLMAMGFSEEAAQEALANGLDFNNALDSLLSSEELDSLPTTGYASDATSDQTSSPIIADKIDELTSEEQDEDFGRPSASETDWEVLLGARETVLSVASGVGLPLSPLGAVSQAVNEASEAVLPLVRHITSEKAQTDAPSARQLARVMNSWSVEGSATDQLSVQCGTLIYTWTGTATENGWIYAERLNMGDSAGWIPTNVLKLLPVGYQWRRVIKSCQSFSDLHLAGEQGEIVLADTESIEEGTDGGWIYAERLNGSQAGWLPTCALEQLSATLQWMHAVRSQEAQHATQASVKEGWQFLVDPNTRTKEGWAYAWTVDRHDGDSAKHSAEAGWVPVNCLEWPQE